MTTNDKQTDYEAALRRLNDRFPPKPDSVNPTQALTDALDAAGLRLVVGEIWLIGPDGSRISLTALVADMPIRGWQRRVEVGAVPKESAE